MTEPRVRYETNNLSDRRKHEQPRRAVQMLLPLEWAQAVVRLQQLHNEGYLLVRLTHDESGRVRIEPQ